MWWASPTSLQLSPCRHTRAPSPPGFGPRLRFRFRFPRLFLRGVLAALLLLLLLLLLELLELSPPPPAPETLSVWGWSRPPLDGQGGPHALGVQGNHQYIRPTD